MPGYSRINSSLWVSSARWKQLRSKNLDPRLLYLYLHTNDHRRKLWTYVLPEERALLDLGCSEAVYRKGIDTLCHTLLIGYTEAETVVHVLRAIDKDPPTNPKHCLAWIKEWEELPDCDCKWMCLTELQRCKHWPKTYTPPTDSPIPYRYPIDTPRVGKGREGSAVPPTLSSSTTALGAELKQLGAVGRPFLQFPTVGTNGKVWTLTQEQVDQWGALFPSLDVAQQCQHALAWVTANPPRRKTSRGMVRFLAGWLTRATDRPPVSRADLSGVLRQETAEQLRLADEENARAHRPRRV